MRSRITLRMRKVSSGRFLSPFISSVISNYPIILLAEIEGPDQTALMRSLIRPFIVRICPKTRFAWQGPIILNRELNRESRLKSNLVYISALQRPFLVRNFLLGSFLHSTQSFLGTDLLIFMGRVVVWVVGDVFQTLIFFCCCFFFRATRVCLLSLVFTKRKIVFALVLAMLFWQKKVLDFFLKKSPHPTSRSKSVPSDMCAQRRFRSDCAFWPDSSLDVFMHSMLLQADDRLR